MDLSEVRRMVQMMDLLNPFDVRPFFWNRRVIPTDIKKYGMLSDTGWWFQTVFMFHNIWDNPSHWLSYFSRWLLHHQPDEVSCHFCHHPVLRTGDVPRPVPRTRAGRDSLGASGSACCWGCSDWGSRITNHLHVLIIGLLCTRDWDNLVGIVSSWRCWRSNYRS